MNTHTKCPKCGAQLVKDFWDIVEEQPISDLFMDVFEVMVCNNRCGYYERISQEEEVPEFIAQQDDSRFILLYPNEQGRILDLNQLLLWPKMNVHSLLGRGYWEEYTGNHNVKEILKKVRESGKDIHDF